jgi:hypothetical protein
MTTRLTIDLSPETEQKLKERAARSGLDVGAYARQLIEEGLNGGQKLADVSSATDTPEATRTFDDILAPIRAGFAKSGLTGEELDRLFQEAREEVWQERQKPKDSR